MFHFDMIDKFVWFVGFRSVNCGDFSLVRVGRMSKISESVKGTTLEHLVKHFVQTAGYTRNETSTARFKRALKKINHEIESLEKEKFVLNRDGSSTDNQKIAVILASVCYGVFLQFIFHQVWINSSKILGIFPRERSVLKNAKKAFEKTLWY